MEVLCSLQGKAEADKNAEKGLSLLVPGLLRCKQDSYDTEARHHCQMGVIDAMTAIRHGVPMGASHGIGHQLGPLGVGHGETSCILLPTVCKYNADRNANVERQRKVADILWRYPEVQDVLNARGLREEETQLSAVLDAIIRELGMPRSLKDVGVGKDQIEELAENSLHDRWVATNPVPLKEKQQVLELLEMAIE